MRTKKVYKDRKITCHTPNSEQFLFCFKNLFNLFFSYCFFKKKDKIK